MLMPHHSDKLTDKTPACKTVALCSHKEGKNKCPM